MAAVSVNPDFYFYDVNTKLTYTPGERDIFSMSFYRGKDNLGQSQNLGGGSFNFRGQGNSFVYDQGDSLTTSELTSWGNTGLSGQWSRRVSDRLFSSLMMSYSRYFSNYDRNRSLSSNATEAQDSTNFYRGGIGASEEDNQVEDLTLRLDNEWHLSRGHNLKGGLGISRFSSHYHSAFSDTLRLVDRSTDANQSFLYLQDLWEMSPSLEVTFGLRGNHYNRSGEFYTEPRASFVYMLSDNVKFKAALGQ